MQSKKGITLIHKDDTVEVTVHTENVCLPDLLRDIKGFLQAIGFHIDGDLEVVVEEDYAINIDDDLDDDEDIEFESGSDR